LIAAGLCLAAVLLAPKLKRDIVYERQVRTLLAASGAESKTDFHARADAVRIFVNDNSMHKMDKEFYAIWRDRTKVAGAVLDYSQGRAHQPAHLECSTRQDILHAMLESLGYRTRTVVLYKAAPDLPSHTFLEILNPQTQRWEVEDPAYDIYWRHRKSGARASIVDVMRNPKEFEPCGRKSCGWAQKSREGLKAKVLRPYFGIVTLIDRVRHVRVSLYAAGINPKAVYNDKKGAPAPFCALKPKECRDGFIPVGDYDPARF
jgi:hypothetical protein